MDGQRHKYFKAKFTKGIDDRTFLGCERMYVTSQYVLT